MTQRRLRAPSPALVISLIALFVALGGTTAYASGLISGRQIVDHSIPARKLTIGAVYALRGQPGTRSFAVNAPADSVVHRLTTTHWVDVSYKCDRDSEQIHFYLTSHEGDHGVSVSGDYAPDGVLKSITTGSPLRDQFSGHATLNLDVIASAPYRGGRFSRIDLAGSIWEGDTGDFCAISGLITPSTGLQQPLG